VKREADTLRRQHLEAVLNEAIAANQSKKSKVLTHLIRAEKNNKCYAAFRSHTKPKSSGGLAAINTTTGPENTPTTLTDRTEIEDTLLEYSREHFAKAHGSPFTSEPLSRLLQYDGLTPFGNIIFKGNTDLHSLPLDEPTRTLLEHLNNKLPSDTPRTHPIDYQLLLNGIKKWPEKTTTSPSGRHLGIYKSLQRHVVDKPKTDKKTNPPPPQRLQQGRDILYLIFDIMTLALRHNHTLERWKTVWTIFIEKELGNPDINRLCCIMIFEADWQLLLKWHLSYGFLPKAEQNQTLTPHQGGGRKGRSAIDQALLQVIESELIHLAQRPAIQLYLEAPSLF